ncbi:MAG: ArsR/SmtB family transcription factor [Dermatophilaceae bacterium]
METDLEHDTTRQPVKAERAALRALAHPLRLQILDVLRRGGPGRVTELAETVGESAANTSYHLNQLHQHGYIQPRPDLAANGRERWWQVSEEIRWSSTQSGSDSDGPEPVLVRMQAAQLMQYVAERRSRWSQTWQESSTIGSYQLRLTPEELASFHAEFLELFKRYRSQPPPRGDRDTAENVAVFLNAFPRGNDGES